MLTVKYPELKDEIKTKIYNYLSLFFYLINWTGYHKIKIRH